MGPIATRGMGVLGLEHFHKITPNFIPDYNLLYAQRNFSIKLSFRFGITGICKKLDLIPPEVQVEKTRSCAPNPL